MSHVSPCIVACVLYNLKCVRENELSTQMWVYVQCFQQDLKFIVSGFKSEAWNILYYYSFHKNNNMIVQLKMHTCSLQRFKWSQQNCWYIKVHTADVVVVDVFFYALMYIYIVNLIQQRVFMAVRKKEKKDPGSSRCQLPLWNVQLIVHVQL